MGDQQRPAKARLWRLGVSLGLALAAALVSLRRARRASSLAPAAEHRQANQDPPTAVARQPGQVNPVRRSFGLPRLVLWIAARCGWILVVAGLGAWSLVVAIGQSREVKPPLESASATVISERIDDSDPLDQQVWVHVWFRAKSGRIVHATIQPYPYGFGKVVRGQRLPIIYNANAPSQAAYAGPGGDYARSFNVGALEWPAYFGAAAWFSLAVVLLLTGSSRLSGITRAALASEATCVRLRMSGEIACADQLADNYSLSWRILRDQPNISGDVRILGNPSAAQWLIVRLDDGRLVWPASKAQPLLASAARRLPLVKPGRAAAVHLLLVGYAQIIELLNLLPVVIHRPPESETNWWSLGALRPVVRALVTMHVRRRLALLGSALARAALLCDESDSQSRQLLIEVSDECKTFAEAMPRRSVVVVLATIAATGLSIISPFLLMPHIELSRRVISQDIFPLLFDVFIFAAVPLFIFFRSVRYKRALFNPPVTHKAPIRNTTTANVVANWDVCELERAAFIATAVPEPREWESWKLIRWFVVAVYVAAIGIPFIRANPVFYEFIRFILPFLGVWVALLAVVKIYMWQRQVRTIQSSLSRHAPPDDAARSSDRHTAISKE